MKMSKILMVFIIGIISLNVIFAGSIQKSFLIKGDFTPVTGTVGGMHPCDGADPNLGNCKIQIIAPDIGDISSSCNFSASNIRLRTTTIKSILNSGITTPVLDITSTSPTVNFTIKIMQGHPSYSTEILSTIVQVPNPNAAGTQVSANIIEQIAAAPSCDPGNVGTVRVINGVFKVCKIDDTYNYVWDNFIQGTAAGLVTSDFYNRIFFKCQNPSGCLDLGPGSYDKIILRNGSIINQYIAPNSISISNLSQELKDYIDSKESIVNITNVTEVTDIIETTQLIDISNDSITFDHLNVDLKNRVGNFQELTSSDISGLEDSETTYYVVTDVNTGNSYYMPVKLSTGFEFDAIRNLVTLSAFDDGVFERTTGTSTNGYSNSYPPSVPDKKFSDFIYPRTDRKYIAKGKYLPIDVTIRKGGANAYTIKFYECYNLGSAEDLGHKVTNSAVNSWCIIIPNSRIKGTTYSESLSFSGNEVNVNTTAGTVFNKKYHVKITNTTNKYIVTKVTGPDSVSVNEISAGMSVVYDPITNIEQTYVGISPTTCYYTIENGNYNFTVPKLQFTATGGSSGSTTSGEQNYFVWSLAALNFDLTPTDLLRSKTDNQRTGFDNVDITIPSSSGSYQGYINLTVAIKDKRTGQRFAKNIAINGCTLYEQ